MAKSTVSAYSSVSRPLIYSLIVVFYRFRSLAIYIFYVLMLNSIRRVDLSSPFLTLKKVLTSDWHLSLKISGRTVLHFPIHSSPALIKDAMMEKRWISLGRDSELTLLLYLREVSIFSSIFMKTAVLS